MGTGFAGIADTAFTVEGVSDEMDYEVVGRRNDPVVVARFRLDAGSRTTALLMSSASTQARECSDVVSPTNSSARTRFQSTGFALCYEQNIY